MEIELHSGSTFIRMSDEDATIGDAALSDVLGELLSTFRQLDGHVSGEIETSLAKGDFGFRPGEVD